MPVSYNLKKKIVSMNDDITPESFGIVQGMLKAGEILELSVSNIDPRLLSLLDLRYLTAFSIADFSSFDLRLLGSIEKLKSLHLGAAKETGRNIRLDIIPAIDSLTSLSIANIEGLRNLPPLINLQELSLRGVTSDNFDFLDSYPYIRDIFISGGHLNGYKRLLQCEKLARLRIIQTRHIDFAGIIKDRNYNHSLKILELSHCPSLTDFNFLELFTALKYMDITSCKNLVSYKGIEKCSNLEVINISECSVKDKTLSYLAGIKNVLLGISYKKKEIELFEKEFRGDMYSIGKFDKGNFDYLDHYTKFYCKSLETITVI